MTRLTAISTELVYKILELAACGGDRDSYFDDDSSWDNDCLEAKHDAILRYENGNREPAAQKKAAAVIVSACGTPHSN